MRPPGDFASADLDLFTVQTGDVWGRIYPNRFPNPLGFGKSGSRFSDPRRRVSDNRFGVLYLGRDRKACFVEAVLRDARDAVVADFVMDEAELTSRRYVEIEVVRSLNLIDLREDARIRQAVPSEVVGRRSQGLARRWSVAFFEHPRAVDGMIYPSRLNGIDTIALYDRAVPRLKTDRVYALDAAPGLGAVLDTYKIALAPA